MQAFIDFLVNNYLWFLVISLILLFALIGYLVDTNEKKENTSDTSEDEETIDTNEIEENIENNNNNNNSNTNTETEILEDFEE
jgi:hypothetical protein